MILISGSSTILNFFFTSSIVKLINFSISKLESPWFSIKLQCFFENLTLPKFFLSQPLFCINSHALIFESGFLNVLPPVFIFDGCAISFFF